MYKRQIKRCDNIIEKIKDRTEKCNRYAGKLNENKDDQVIDDKVSECVSVNDNYNDMTNNNGDIIENVVSESCILNNGSDDEILLGVEVSEEEVVNEFERVCEVRLGEQEGQRANFPCGISGVRTPHVVNEDKGSSRCYMGDMVCLKVVPVSYTHLDVYKRQA